MKNFKLFMVLVLALGFATTSCNKDDDNDNNNLTSTFKGSASITVDGTLYNKLTSDVVEMDEGVTFFLEDNNGDEFQVAIANVPEVGETSTLSLESSDNATDLLVANGPIAGIIALIGGSGTVKRTSEADYEIDAILYGGDFFTGMYTITGTVHVGQFGY